MTAPIVSVADQLAQRAREVLPIAPDADVIVGVVNGRIIRVEVDGINLPVEAWQPHQARFADLMGGACDADRWTVSLLHVLQHALGRDQYGKSKDGRADYRNHFCAGEGHADLATCRGAVTQGLMREHPPSEISGGDSIFVVTDAGKAYIAANSPPEPKLTRGQRRYREWLGSSAAGSGVAFGAWIRGDVK